jgi:hypothetical protein
MVCGLWLVIQYSLMLVNALRQSRIDGTVRLSYSFWALLGEVDYYRESR